MTNLWKKVTGPSAGLVQQHFIKSRIDDLKRRNPALEQKVGKVLMENAALGHLKLKPETWLAVYDKINKGLQAAELTINFKAESWFATENTYASYTQMYERSIDADGKLLLKSDRLNPADVRARVDDKVTIPAAWNAPAPAARRGLTPGVRSGHSIQKHMAFGQQQRVEKAAPATSGALWDMPATELIGVRSLNPQFNPKTKQIFAALNYGRRPHGSSTQYGKSFLVLHPRFKMNALYFGGDTFSLEFLNRLDQTPYGMLGSVIAHAQPKLVGDIIASCYFDRQLGDATANDSLDLLLEAHLFAELTFGGNIEAVCLPASHKGDKYDTNARKFAHKHGAKFRYVWA